MSVEIPVGTVTHYYNNIGVAAVQLHEPLRLTDIIHIKGKQDDFLQEVRELQHQYEPVIEGSPGQVITMKVDRRVKKNDRVFALANF